MDFNMEKNIKRGLLLSTLSLSLASLLACTDYADEYAGDWGSVYGDDAKVEDETPQYSMDCENVLWYAYDGDDFMEQTALGTSWENFADANSDILFTGLDKNNIRFNANFLENDLTPYLRYKGGISGELLVPEGSQDFFAGVRFGFGETDVLKLWGGDEANIEGFCLAYKSAYDDIVLSLMDVDDNGEILTEFRTGPLGASSEVQTIKVPLSSFKFSIGDLSLDAMNSLGVVFTAKNRDGEGFVIVGVGTYGGTKPVLPEPESSSSSADKKVSSSSSAKSSSSSMPKSSSSVKSSSSSKPKSSSSMFYWSAIDETASSDIDWYNYTDSSDASNGGKSYFQWPATIKDDGNMDGVVRACNGLCGAVHMRLGGNSDPYAGVGFTVSPDQREKIRSSMGMCVTYVSEAPVKMRLLPENPEKFNYDVPVKILEKAMQVTTMNIGWSNYSESSAGSGIQVAAALNSVDFQFEGMSTPDAFFDILAVGEYDACSQFPLVVTSGTIEELKTKINMDKYEYSSYATDILQEDILWYGGNVFKGVSTNENGLLADEYLYLTEFNNGNVTNENHSSGDDWSNEFTKGDLANCNGAVCGTVSANLGENVYPVVTFNVADDESKKDISEWGGLCVTYSATRPGVEMNIGRHGLDLYYVVELPASEGDTTVCYSWDKFSLVGTEGRILIDDFVKEVQNINFSVAKAKGGDFKIIAVGKYPDGKDEYQNYLKTSCYKAMWCGENRSTVVYTDFGTTTFFQYTQSGETYDNNVLFHDLTTNGYLSQNGMTISPDVFYDVGFYFYSKKAVDLSAKKGLCIAYEAESDDGCNGTRYCKEYEHASLDIILGLDSKYILYKIDANTENKKVVVDIPFEKESWYSDLGDYIESDFSEYLKHAVSVRFGWMAGANTLVASHKIYAIGEYGTCGSADE